MNPDILKLQHRLRKAERVAVLTGAGISAESGVPTFRGTGGIWRTHRAVDLATPEAFARNPELVWEFYNWRRSLIHRVDCNPGHRALAVLERQIPQFTLITQNIDGLHIRAGSRKIIEIHGNLWRLRCTACREISIDHRPDVGNSPRCRSCQSLLRPDVVWFGENLDADLLRHAFETSADCDVMLVVGTSAVVQPAASFPIKAKSHGAVVVEINTERTPLSDLLDMHLFGKAGEILPLLLDNARPC